MASPMTAGQLLRQLDKWHVNYRTYKNWSYHNRNHVNKWGPVNGVLWHHTGTDSEDQRDLLYDGYSGLPGPLCHFGIAQNGIVWLVGWGRANHAGLGDDDVLRALIREDRFPVDNEANTDGNARLYGLEIWYDGSHKMTKAQYKSSLLVTAAICDLHGWSGKSVLGHKEWQPGKPDPGKTSMKKVRKDVSKTLISGPSSKVITVAKTYDQTWNTDKAVPPKHFDRSKNKFWKPISLLRHAAEQAWAANHRAYDNGKRLDRIEQMLENMAKDKSL